MPGTVPYPNTAPTRGAAVILAVLTAAVTACTPKAPTGTNGSAAQRTRITGAGSTFDALFFDQAFPAYQQSHPGVTVSYAATGSDRGVRRFTTGEVDFAATDVPASQSDLAAARGGPTIQVPVDLGAVSVAYNVLTLNNAPVKLTGPVLARIFLGQITRWSDPAIADLNPGADLPDAYITVVHRSDGSATTYMFSEYLSSVSPAWASAVGTGRSLRWPAGYAAGDNLGVVTAINRIPYSIGYVDRPSAPGIAPGSAAIANRDGRFVTPTAGAITADAAAKPVVTPQDFSIINEPGPAAYPISGYSWVLISEHQPSERARRALVGLFSWLTKPGQSYAAALGYAPLPAFVQHDVATALARVTGPWRDVELADQDADETAESPDAARLDPCAFPRRHRPPQDRRRNVTELAPPRQVPRGRPLA